MTIGALALPAQVNLAAVTDPILTHLPGFLSEALTVYLRDAWSRVSPDPVVRCHYGHDPEVADVAAKDFPALFVWRAATGPVDRQEDRTEFHARINVLWVFAVEKQLKLILQLPVFNGIEKALFRALDVGRTPRWKVQGDTDPSAPTKGSLVWKYAGGEFKNLLSANPDAGVTVEMTTGGKLDEFPALLFTIDILESETRTATSADYVQHRNTTTLTHPTPDETVRLVAIDEPPTPP